VDAFLNCFDAHRRSAATSGGLLQRNDRPSKFTARERGASQRPGPGEARGFCGGLARRLRAKV